MGPGQWTVPSGLLVRYQSSFLVPAPPLCSQWSWGLGGGEGSCGRMETALPCWVGVPEALRWGQYRLG